MVELSYDNETEPSINESFLPTEVKSCFIEGTNIQYAIDSTSIGALKTCAQYYKYTIIDGYVSNEESAHLRFGQEYHTVIEHYENSKAEGHSHKDAMRQAIKDLLIRTRDWEVDTTTRAGKYKNRQTLLELSIDYLDKYIDDGAKTYIRENGEAAVELSFRFELDWTPRSAPDQLYLLCGHLDRVVDFNSSLFVMDHKTSMGSLTDYFFDGFNPSNQMTLYTLAAKVVLNSPVAGVIIDAAQICLEQPNQFRRGITTRTPEQLDEWTADLEYWLRQAESFAIANYWPMNEQSCGMYGGCRFRQVCSKAPSVRHI